MRDGLTTRSPVAGRAEPSRASTGAGPGPAGGRRPSSVAPPRTSRTDARSAGGVASTTVLPRPRPLRCGLEFDDGSFIVVRGHGLIGRDPTAPAGEKPAHMVTLADSTCSISRTHLEFWIGNSGLWIRDRHSTNGSEVEVYGRRTRIKPGMAVSVPPTSTIHVGGQRIRVRAVNSRAVIDAVTVEWGAATRVGARRAHNQDTFGARPPVFVVADGIGGHCAGDLASREAVQSLLAVADRAEVTDEMLDNALADARARINRIPVSDGKRPPGTTISGVIVTYCNGVPCWMVVNLGDSRTYRLDAKGLRQLSVDHSVGQKLIEAGVAQAGPQQLPVGNILTRAVVGGREHSPDVWRLPMHAGDRILVCSDGLSSAVDDSSIMRVLQTVRDPQAAVDALIDTAIRAGGGDDATAVVVDAVAIRPRHYSDMSTRAARRGALARDTSTTGRLPTDRTIFTTRARWRA